MVGNIVMDKATGKIGNELTSGNNIPQEHWDKFEATIRELSKRGIQTDLTKEAMCFMIKTRVFSLLI
jgi:hypothetical protein